MKKNVRSKSNNCRIERILLPETNSPSDEITKMLEGIAKAYADMRNMRAMPSVSVAIKADDRKITSSRFAKLLDKYGVRASFSISWKVKS